jgi:hypothetical protein
MSFPSAAAGTILMTKEPTFPEEGRFTFESNEHTPIST